MYPFQSINQSWGFSPRESPISVRSTGARGDGLSDDTQAIQAAVDLAAAAQGGEIVLPPGTYRTSAPIVLHHRNISLEGLANHRTTINPLDSFAGEELISIQRSDCRVGNLNVRPRAGVAGIRVRGAALAHVHDCLFMSVLETIGEGIGIVFDDRDAGGVLRSGSYFHRVERCQFSIGGLHLEHCIVTDAQDTINQCVLYANRFLGDAPIVWLHGGGNWFCGNLIQSITGAPGAPVGIGIECVHGQVVTGNFFEQLEWSLSLIDVENNHQGLENNWYDQVQNPIGAAQPSTITVPADETLIVPIRRVHRLTGGGALRSDCGLAAGARPGQELKLIGFSWGVRIITNGAGGAGAPIVYQSGLTANPNFTNSSGGVSVMELIWDRASGVWREVSRAVVP